MNKSSEAPVVIRHTSAAQEWANSTERVPVFTIERTVQGEDDAEPRTEQIEYTMPAKPNPGLALEYLRMARKQGEVANAWIIETAIGTEGYDALVEDLVSYDGDPVELLQNIVAKIQRVAMGGLDRGPKA